MTDFNPSKEFADFVFLAIDHGFGSIEGGGGPLVPFTMEVDQSGKKQLTRFALAKLEDGLQKAQQSVFPSKPISMYAIAWDGYITVKDRKWDAILVEAGEASTEFAVLFAQRYVQSKKGLFRKTRCERVGNPALVGEPLSRLRERTGQP